MKALLQYGGRDMRLEDVPEPEPGLNEVKINLVKWCGICGSDVNEYQGRGGLLPLKKPHPVLISSRISLDDIIEKGFEELSGERRSEHRKILVSPEL